MPGIAEMVLVLGLHAAAGGLVYIFLLNRLLNRMRGSWLKLALILALMLVCTLAPPTLGWFLLQADLASGWRWLLPGLVGLGWLAGDVRLAKQRQRHRSYPPAQTDPPRLAGIAYLRRPVTTLDLTTVGYDLPWDGPALTLVQLTDLHLNHAIPMAFYRKAIERANQIQPDLIFISGDFVSHRHEISLLPDLLAGLRTSDRVSAEGITPGRAIFASLGNHDYWSDPEAVREVLSEQRIVQLSGRLQEIQIHGKAFTLGADDRPWGKRLEPQAAAQAALPLLVLSHSPDNIYALAGLPGCTAVFSGHVHGGQLRLPQPWNSRSASLVVPSIYGRLLDHGHFAFSSPNDKPVHLFISAGIGSAEPPLRLYCPPEILVVRFWSRGPNYTPSTRENL
jgi:hypothetical protein